MDNEKVNSNIGESKLTSSIKVIDTPSIPAKFLGFCVFTEASISDIGRGAKKNELKFLN